MMVIVMPHTRIVVTVLLLLLASPQGHSQISTESTFVNYVNTQRMSICAESPIPNCESDFELPTRVGEQLDKEEERAKAFDKAGDEKAAHKVRVHILQQAIMLDEWLDGLIMHHKRPSD